MTPEQKCVSSDTAIALEVAGFPQNTERWWIDKTDFDGQLWIENHEPTYELGSWAEMEEWSDTGRVRSHYAAPDAQEIGELLPRNLGSELFMQLRKSGWLVRVDGYEVLHENEAEARAACWLWLKENKLI